MSKVFVAENGQKVIANNEVQEAAFINAGFKEEKESKKK